MVLPLPRQGASKAYIMIIEYDNILMSAAP